MKSLFKKLLNFPDSVEGNVCIAYTLSAFLAYVKFFSQFLNPEWKQVFKANIRSIPHFLIDVNFSPLSIPNRPINRSHIWID